MWEYKLFKAVKLTSSDKLKAHLEEILNENAKEGWRFKENLGYFWMFEREIQ